MARHCGARPVPRSHRLVPVSRRCCLLPDRTNQPDRSVIDVKPSPGVNLLEACGAHRQPISNPSSEVGSIPDLLGPGPDPVQTLSRLLLSRPANRALLRVGEPASGRRARGVSDCAGTEAEKPSMARWEAEMLGWAAPNPGRAHDASARTFHRKRRGSRSHSAVGRAGDASAGHPLPPARRLFVPPVGRLPSRGDGHRLPFPLPARPRP